jgi:hypothetical protein
MPGLPDSLAANVFAALLGAALAQIGEIMHRSWARIWRVTVLAAPVLASLALGTAATASPSAAGRAPVPASARAVVTWHALTLKNGWKSAQKLESTGNPAWTVKGGVVYLSGSILQSQGSVPEFAVLPKAAWPSHTMYITNYTLDGAHGHLYAKPNGQLWAYGTNAQNFFSLAGISWPARTMKMHPLALRNGWNSSQFRWNTGDPAYAVRNGVVYLAGSLHQRVAGSTIFAKLPVAARPLHNLYITVDTFGATTGILFIKSDGDMEAYSGSARSFTSLAGVSFPARSLTPHALTLLNGWQSSQGLNGTGDPAYAVHDGVVYLVGSLQSGTNEQFDTLPRPARPRHQLFMKIYANNGAVASLKILPTGEADVFGTGSNIFSSLATISYPLGS